MAGEVEGSEVVVEAPLAFTGDSFGASEVEDGIALAVERDSLEKVRRK